MPQKKIFFPASGCCLTAAADARRHAEETKRAKKKKKNRTDAQIDAAGSCLLSRVSFTCPPSGCVGDDPSDGEPCVLRSAAAAPFYISARARSLMCGAPISIIGCCCCCTSRRSLHLLAGCGHYDGSVPLEVMSLLLHLENRRVGVRLYGPEIWDHQNRMLEINHIYGTAKPVVLNPMMRIMDMLPEYRIDGWQDLLQEDAIRGYDGVFIPGGESLLAQPLNSNLYWVIRQANLLGIPLATISNAGVLAAWALPRILSGCTASQGTDPLEAACLIIQLARHGIKADFFAPNTTLNLYWDFQTGQYHRSDDGIIDPRLRLTAREEAARLIPMHRVKQLNRLRTEHYDALIIPGGAGVLLALAGCGHGDGTNVLEAMSLAINLQRHNIHPHFYTWNYEIQPYNHNTEREFNDWEDPDKELWEAPRYSLMDAARLIDEKSIRDLHGLADDKNRRHYCGLFIPGGRGVMKDEFTSLVRRVIYDFHRDEKPIATIADGALLVCPQLRGVRITIGTTRKRAHLQSRKHIHASSRHTHAVGVV
ncbi:unnamed protein product [Trichogramma brassicae]|uniref:DJ-1/PfpI domain-containing protein n=1 Tax=Trichogramma brassicae TaxID=86971 RepID=A0A6H5I5J0_9HYME|nr:unnamed protein product [Trichogramma brassicae]